MTRKNNPWVAMVALVLLLVLVVCTCASCGRTTDAAETKTARFIVEEVNAKTLGPHQHVEIITDTETGVQYIFFKSSNAGGLTVLEPAPEEGKP